MKKERFLQSLLLFRRTNSWMSQVAFPPVRLLTWRDDTQDDYPAAVFFKIIVQGVTAHTPLRFLRCAGGRCRSSRPSHSGGSSCFGARCAGCRVPPGCHHPILVRKSNERTGCKLTKKPPLPSRPTLPINPETIPDPICRPDNPELARRCATGQIHFPNSARPLLQSAPVHSTTTQSTAAHSQIV